MNTVKLPDEIIELEDEFRNTPAMFSRGLLECINARRAHYGLPTVDANLKPVKPVATIPTPVRKPVRDHTEAKQAYEAFLAHVEYMRPHVEYCDMICRATHGSGMTPVAPLATMGTPGNEYNGAIVCDHCGKPLILEGGRFNRMTVDKAWAIAKPNEKTPLWKSYISGGCVFHVESNGTVRVYHGHPERDQECYELGRAAEAARERDHVNVEVPKGLPTKLTHYLNDEHPDWCMTQVLARVNDIINALYRYDPGIGRNRPN